MCLRARRLDRCRRGGPIRGDAAGRCPFTVTGLLALADLADRLRARREAAGL